MSDERRVTIYECKDGYVVHDTDKHIIHVYHNPEIVNSQHKTAREVCKEI